MGNLAAGNLRLNNSIRERIAKAMINFKYEKGNPFQKHVDEHASIAMAVYNRVFDQAKRDKMAAIPNGWLPKTDYIQAKFGFDTPWLYFGGSIQNMHGMTYELSRKFDIYSLCTSVEMVIPENYRRGIIANFEHDDPLTERYDAYKVAVKETVSEVKTTYAMVNSTLAKFNTTNRLIEAWPECKPFVQKIVGKEKPSVSTALAIPISDLNAKLGLPVPAAATV